MIHPKHLIAEKLITFLFEKKIQHTVCILIDLEMFSRIHPNIFIFLFFSPRIFSFPSPSHNVHSLFRLPSFSLFSYVPLIFSFCSAKGMRFQNIFGGIGWTCAQTSAVQSFDNVNMVTGERLKQTKLRISFEK